MKKFYFILLILLTITISCAYDNDDNINKDILFSPLEEITTDSELFENLKQITTNDTRPDKNITCINFKYPLTIFIFDENDEFLSVNPISDDESFSSLLENIDSENSISVSFPITSTLDTGEEFIIETKEDLKEAIDNCLDEELVFECNQLLQNCIFKVGYSYDYDNLYLGGIFQEDNGLTTLIHDEETYNGSWIALLIEDELHININIVDATTDIEEFFNYDWIVEYVDENSISLRNGDREIILNQRCDEDYDACLNFNFEVCENEVGSGISDFILDDYIFCIFDTLELDEDLSISFYETEEDSENMENPILTDQIYNNVEAMQSIYGRIDNVEDDETYFFQITLVSTGC